ncbi:lipoprotein [Spiroplasma endosymbiont of Seladonia tumulorum]|uniref:lipoprotein n=1 Tax=Spiroplasma endosymbiont of Seladonia tumulorum TaxID=3066321 RepID=UPI0030D35DFE
MKKILSILVTITLIGTSTTSLVACNTLQKYSPEKLKELKEKKKIDTKNQEIRDNLEWIAPQEKPFNIVDNKWYYVVWRSNKNDKWRISKYKNNIELDYNNDVNIDGVLFLIKLTKSPNDLVIKKNKYYVAQWLLDKNNYFKSVYCWNLIIQEPDLIIDKDGNVKVNGE